MEKRDIQIMEILAQNCRIPNSTIAQALNISKDTISYRLKQLEKTNYIQQYMLFIDARRLGFTRYHILIKLETGIKDKEKVYNKISNNPFVMWINTFIGRYDLQIIVDATDGFHLNKIKEEIFQFCGNKIKEYIILTHLSDFEFTQLNPALNLNTKFQKKLDHSFSSLLSSKRFPVNKEFKTYQPTLIETKILKILADNPKENIIDIGRIIKIDRATIKKRIINLIKEKIIIHFGAIANLSKQGFVTYYLLVRLTQKTPQDILKKPFNKLQNIFYAGNMIGDYDMILYLNARTPQELNSSIELFKSEIEEFIVHYDLLVQDKVHHWKQFTPGIYNNLIENAKK